MNCKDEHLLSATIVAGKIYSVAKAHQEISGFGRFQDDAKDAVRKIAWEHLVNDDEFVANVERLLDHLRHSRRPLVSTDEDQEGAK